MNLFTGFGIIPIYFMANFSKAGLILGYILLKSKDSLVPTYIIIFLLFTKNLANYTQHKVYHFSHLEIFKSVHTIVKSSPPPNTRMFLSSTIQILYSLNSNSLFTSHSSSWQPPTYVLPLWMWLFYILHINGIIICSLLLISLSIMLSNFTVL